MNSKLEEHFGIWNCHHWATWWNECNYIQLRFHLYFNNVIVLQSTKEGCSWLGKIKSIETPVMPIKSDVLAMTPGGSLYPCSADMSSTALIYLPDTSPMSNGCGKYAGTNSIYCPSHNAVHDTRGFAPSTVVDCVLQLHDIATTLVQDFSHYMITDYAAPIDRCRNLSAVLQLPRVLSS